ncbi:MAG: hypothetical protein ACI4W2_01120 [Eubacterium sp.]
MNARDVMENLSKEDLIDLVFEYSDNGYFPLEPFLLRADYAFTLDDLTEIWKSAYEKAKEYEDQTSDLGADLLRDIAELCFEHAKKLQNAEEQAEVLQMLVDDLAKASEEDGIGMYTDSEWLYDEVRGKIEEWKDK